MRIIDCTLYSGESIVLFRLAYLWDVVDKFVMVEARETHSGEKKQELYLDKYANEFAPFFGKITCLVIDRFPDPSSADLERLTKWGYTMNQRSWFREVYQRNYPASYLNQLGPAIVWCCDADEIPRRETMRALRGHYLDLDTPRKLEMSLFYYSSDWVKRYKWNRAFVVNDRGIGRASIDEMRTSADTKRLVPNAGWHLSYFMTAPEIARKVGTFTDAQLNTDQNRNIDWIQHCQRTGLDLFHRGRRQDCRPYTGSDLPEGLREFELEKGIRS